MEYKLGNSLKTKSIGNTVNISCPECGKSSSFGVFTNADTRLSARFPLFTHEDVYFLVCPCCASVFTVDERSGKEFKKGEPLSIGSYDLKKLKEFK